MPAVVAYQQYQPQQQQELRSPATGMQFTGPVDIKHNEFCFFRITTATALQ